jgi:1-acyl-sn-glycerol-3-phosphate acyltransferase
MRLKPLYTFLKYYVHIGFKVYYQRFQIEHKERVPRAGPVIFAINHQNAFIDPMVIAVASPRRPWFLTRASIFKSAVARFWLGALKMIPIYRIRDGIDQVKRNDSTISRCVDLLLEGQSILIFPEGDHSCKWQLRPFQKGLARIAFNTLEAKSDCGLKIVPVGLQHEDYRKFGSDLLVSFGKPIAAIDFFDVFKNDPPKGIELLTAETRQRISELMVDIQDADQYDEIKQQLSQRKREENLDERLKNDQQFVAGNLQIATEENRRQKSTVFFNIFGFPFFVYALLNNLLPIVAIRWIIKRFVLDHHWISSIRFAGMILVTPLFYTMQLVIFYWITGDWILFWIYFVSLPFSAWFGSLYWQKVSAVRF